MPTTWTTPAAAGTKYADHLRVSEAACTTGTEALPPYQGQWGGGVNYGAPALVTYQGVLYLSALANNQGNVPGSGSPWWTQVVGLDLKNVASVGVHVELPAGVIGAGASIQMYLVNPATGVPLRAPDLDQALVAGLAGQALAGFAILGGLGRLIGLPSGVGAPCNVWLNGQLQPGILAS